MADGSAATVRFALVGLVSDHVWSLIDALRSVDGVRFVAVVEPVERLRRRAVSILPGIDEFASLEAVPPDLVCDAILVCTDNRSKSDAARWALARGAAVYQDKPLALDAGRAGEIADAVASSGGTLMCAYHTVFDPLHDEVRDLVRGGLLGKVSFARGLAGHSGLESMGVSEEFAQWLTDPRRGGGGSFVDQAGYLLTTLVDYLGPVASIVGMASSPSPAPVPGVEENTVAILRFASGALAQIDTRWGQIGPLPIRYAFHGSEGTATCYHDRWEIFCRADHLEGWEAVPAPPGLFGWLGRVDPRRDYRAEALHFVDHLRTGSALKPAVTVASAAHVQDVIDGYYAAVREQRVVEIEPRGAAPG